MMAFWRKTLQINFEHRVTISYAIFGLAILAMLYDNNYMYLRIAEALRMDPGRVMTSVFLAIACINLACWLYRSYAGAYLSGKTVFTKTVQSATFVTSGPYAYTRNPIYLSDIISMTSIGFAGPISSVLILFLGKITTSYMYCIYEEDALLKKWGSKFSLYMRAVPRFIPRLRAYSKERAKVNWGEGLIYNFYALGIAAGFLVSAFTHNRNHLYIIGAVLPAGWFFIRFVHRHVR